MPLRPRSISHSSSKTSRTRITYQAWNSTTREMDRLLCPREASDLVICERPESSIHLPSRSFSHSLIHSDKDLPWFTCQGGYRGFKDETAPWRH